MKEPLVSILVLTYNHADYIVDCIEGILSQKASFEFEILIGDDCSADGTFSILQSYANKYPTIRLFKPDYNQFSRGIDLFITHLIPNSQGRYVAFCEGDDYWTDNQKLQRQIDFLEREQSYSMCFHDHKIVGSETIMRNRYHSECDAQLSETLHLNLYQTATMVGRRDALTTEKFKSYYLHPKHHYSDVNILTAFFECGKVKHLVGDWSVYRVHGDSVTSTDIVMGNSYRKHLDCIVALTDCYPKTARNLMRDFISIKELNTSSTMKHISLIKCLRTKMCAFIKSPILILRLYMIKYHLI